MIIYFEKGTIEVNLVTCDIKRLVPFYLMTGYLYYQLDESVISDHDFDFICRRLLKEWNTFEHPQKHLITIEALKAGTAFHLKAEDYPLMARHAAEAWLYCWRQNIERYKEIPKKKSKGGTTKKLIVADDLRSAMTAINNNLGLNDPRIRKVTPHGKSIIVEVNVLD